MFCLLLLMNHLQPIAYSCCLTCRLISFEKISKNWKLFGRLLIKSELLGSNLDSLIFPLAWPISRAPRGVAIVWPRALILFISFNSSAVPTCSGSIGHSCFVALWFF